MNSPSDNQDRVGELLARAEARLAGIADSPRREARLLLRLATGLGEARLLAFEETVISGQDRDRFLAMLDRRGRGEPLAHITNEREFWSLPLRVTADTLIPRPDTELLVSTALDQVRKEGSRVLDLGTGSGAIALALASERPGWSVTATERSEAALAVARENGDRLGLTVEWCLGDWFDAVPGRHFDLIVSNPPYVAEQDPHLVQGDVRFEPLTALTAGPDGLDDIRRIVANAAAHLTPGGWLMIEHGHDQGEALRGLMHQQGFAAPRTLQDLAGRDRVSLARHGRR